MTIDGSFESSSEMVGFQHGTAVCSGPDCDFAEHLLGTQLPRTFDIDLEGTHL